MPLQIELRDREGHVVDAAEESWDAINSMWPELDPDRFPLLGGVDRDALTMFNRHQLRILLPELEALLNELHDRQADLVREVLRLVRTGLGTTDSQLWFVGD